MHRPYISGDGLDLIQLNIQAQESAKLADTSAILNLFRFKVRRQDSIVGETWGYEKDKEVVVRVQTELRDITRSRGFIINEHRKSRENNLEDLLWSCQESSCSDPRDKIYGLLGLALDCRNDEISVDYSKSLFEVYKDVIDFYSKSRRNPETPYMPSVVRFSQLVQRIFANMHELEKGPKLHSIQHYQAFTYVHARGIIGGKVARLKISPRAGNQQNTKSASTGGTDVDKEFLEVMEMITTITPNESYGWKAENDPADMPEVTSDRCSIESTIQADRSLGTMLFKLDNGRTGIISKNAQKGDLVCQFLGCDVCAVLRMSPDGRRYYVVGRAMIRKSILESRLEENLHWDEAKIREMSHSVPIIDGNAAWPLSQTINLELDIVTLQQLTR